MCSGGSVLWWSAILTINHRMWCDVSGCFLFCCINALRWSTILTIYHGWVAGWFWQLLWSMVEGVGVEFMDAVDAQRMCLFTTMMMEMMVMTMITPLQVCLLLPSPSSGWRFQKSFAIYCHWTNRLWCSHPGLFQMSSHPSCREK